MGPPQRGQNLPAPAVTQAAPGVTGDRRAHSRSALRNTGRVFRRSPDSRPVVRTLRDPPGSEGRSPIWNKERNRKAVFLRKAPGRLSSDLKARNNKDRLDSATRNLRTCLGVQENTPR